VVPSSQSLILSPAIWYSQEGGCLHISLLQCQRGCAKCMLLSLYCVFCPKASFGQMVTPCKACGYRSIRCCVWTASRFCLGAVSRTPLRCFSPVGARSARVPVRLASGISSQASRCGTGRLLLLGSWTLRQCHVPHTPCGPAIRHLCGNLTERPVPPTSTALTAVDSRAICWPSVRLLR